MRVILSGGGTGGHIYPALAIIGGLKETFPGVEVLYIGTSRGLEAEIVPREDIPFATVDVSGMRRRLSLETFLWAGKTGAAVLRALSIVRRFRPSLVVGTGGYVCAPVVLAAHLLRIPILLHEQNAFPGKTNRWLSPWAERVMVTFPESARYFKHKDRVVHTGLPVRREIFETSRATGAGILGVSPDKRTLLVVGGSQGAHSINQAVVPVAEYIRDDPRYQLIWVTGTKDYDWVMAQLDRRGIKPDSLGNITIKPYLHEMAAALAVADLVISRAGATFLAEIMARGVASILIPYPYATDNHQEYNAKSLTQKGAALMLANDELASGILLAKTRQLLNNPKALSDMARAAKTLGRPEALDNILEQIKNCIF
ncbi:MAG: undecaprenyldiphospho-muramoylpentapeptide beta-N-acetylglucosaminyltransferase [Thermoanaerobacteraceae bacterium]|nr:undecaprenyldiphospho-muramoylpentapeptide beta-N-acetylglucosaminyltransferase [Thermoanaerobacteraceae bacterium]